MYSRHLINANVTDCFNFQPAFVEIKHIMKLGIFKSVFQLAVDACFFPITFVCSKIYNQNFASDHNFMVANMCENLETGM